MQKQFKPIIQLIHQARERAYRAVNTQLIDLYWNLRKYLSEKIEASEWGESVIQDLATFIQKTETDIRGFSDKNLWRMKQFYETYKDETKLLPLVREISWTNNLIILSRTKSIEEKAFYIDRCMDQRYSKRELDRQISVGLFERTQLTITKLSPVVSEIYPNAVNHFKDSYVFDFLNLKEDHSESELQKALINQLKEFILELGKDFLFVGEEYKLQVGSSDFFINLLFYHRSLQCLVAFELKADKFKPEHLGQLNFYLEALDRDVKKQNENPSIGILLCKDKDVEVVEYALSRSLSPAMISEYKTKLPDKNLLQQKLHELFK